MRVDPVLLEEARSEPNVLTRAVGHQQSPNGDGRAADESADEHGAPTARGHIEQEEGEGQELEPNGGGEEDARRNGPIAKAPRRERQGERDEVHVAERHLEDQTQEKDVAGRSPRTPRHRERPDESDANGRADCDL